MTVEGVTNAICALGICGSKVPFTVDNAPILLCMMIAKGQRMGIMEDIELSVKVDQQPA